MATRPPSSSLFPTRRSSDLHQRPGPRARGLDLPGPRRGGDARRPRGGCCYVGPRMSSDEPDDMPSDGDSDEEFSDEEGPHTEIVVEITGLSLYTHHGVSDAEREIGQRLVVDLRLEVGEVDATVTDLVEETVDYAEVCQSVALVAQQRSYKTLERLCAAIAERLLSNFGVER